MPKMNKLYTNFKISVCLIPCYNAPISATAGFLEFLCKFSGKLFKRAPRNNHFYMKQSSITVVWNSICLASFP